MGIRNFVADIQLPHPPHNRPSNVHFDVVRDHYGEFLWFFFEQATQHVKFTPDSTNRIGESERGASFGIETITTFPWGRDVPVKSGCEGMSVA